jgi:hypothetical protein
VDQPDNREANGGVGDRRPAAMGVPAQDLGRETYAAHGIRAGGEGHARRRHVDDVGAAAVIEHVRPLEKARERLAVCAVVDEAKAGVRRDLAGDAAHMAASAAERERHAAIVARIEQMGLAEVASPMSGPSAVPENIVSPRNRVLANSFAQAPRPDQDFLISVVALTFYPAMVRSAIQSSRG